MAVEAEQGYLVVAVNTDHTDYVVLAQRLANSIHAWNPNAKVCLLTDHDRPVEGFDFVKMLPYGNVGGYANDWQAWWASPFRETIKLEADMLVTSHIDHWWQLFRLRDVVVSTGARDFYGRLSQSRHYRKVFDDNNLPDVYNAITYWRLSRISQDFFKLTREIFENWQEFKKILKFPDQSPTTDVVYAMAAMIIGQEKVTLPPTVSPSIVHMKRHIIPTQGSDWSKELIWEQVGAGLRINTIAQHGCFHYHVKDWQPDA